MEALESIKQVLMRRDDLSEEEASDLIQGAREEVYNGADPEEVLFDYFSLEPDYIFDLL